MNTCTRLQIRLAKVMLTLSAATALVATGTACDVRDTMHLTGVSATARSADWPIDAFDPNSLLASGVSLDGKNEEIKPSQVLSNQ